MQKYDAPYVEKGSGQHVWKHTSHEFNTHTHRVNDNETGTNKGVINTRK